MNDQPTATLVGDPVANPDAPVKTRTQRIADWKKANQASYQKAMAACCTCTPTRAQMLLVDQFDGRANPPID